MRESTINNIYSFQTIVVFSAVWFKSGVWWHGLVGALIAVPMTAALLQGIYAGMVYKLSGYASQRYPMVFYCSAIILVLYYIIF